MHRARILVALLAVVTACGSSDGNELGEQSSNQGGTSGAAGSGGTSTGGTGATDDPTGCVPGRALPCAGPGACEGYQVCQDDGLRFGTCICPQEAGGAGGSPDQPGPGGSAGAPAGQGGAAGEVGQSGAGQAGEGQGGAGPSGTSGSSGTSGQAGETAAGTSGDSGAGGSSDTGGSGGTSAAAGEAGVGGEAGVAGAGVAGAGDAGQGGAGAGGAGAGGGVAGQGGAGVGGAGSAGVGGAGASGAGQGGAGGAGAAGSGGGVVGWGCLEQGTGTGTSGQVKALDFSVVDAEYSTSLQAIVAVSDQSTLQVVFPWSGATAVKIPLPKKALSVSVGPDGMHAAVGHDGFVSHVDLCSGAVTPYKVSTTAFDVVLGGNGYIYAFPQKDQWERVRAINLATAQETLSGGQLIYAGTVGKLHPDGLSMYGANRGLSPDDIMRFDISSGPASMLYDSPYHGTYPMCGDLWMSDDGKRIFTRCGNVFEASSDTKTDMTYAGSLDEKWVTSVAQSSSADRVVVLPYDQASTWQFVPSSSVVVYDYAFLNPQTTLKLPSFGGLPALGQFVFLHKDGGRIAVLVKADPKTNALKNQGLVTLDVP